MPLMKPNTDVGIVGYGCYIPMYRLPAKEVTRIWNDGQGGVPVIPAKAGISGLYLRTISLNE